MTLQVALQKTGRETAYLLEYAAPAVAGFTFGGLLWSLLYVAAGPYLMTPLSGPYDGVLFWIAGSFVFGLCGGYCIDILPKKRLLMALYSAVGYSLGLGLMVVAIEFIMKGNFAPGAVLFALGTLAGGLAFGLPLKRIRLFLLLGAAGYLVGGGLGLLLYQAALWLIHSGFLPFFEPLPDALMLLGLGVGTGIVLGLGKYIVETGLQFLDR